MASDLSAINPAITPPKIVSVQDLDAVCEDLDPQTGQVRYTTFYIFDGDDRAFWGKILKPKNDITVKEYQSALDRIPDESLYPKMSADLELSNVETLRADDRGETFVKRPNLAILDLVQDASFLSDLLLSEVRVLQRIAKAPHQYLIGYRGIRVRRGRVSGIVLDKHDRTLLDHVKSQRRLDIGSVIMALGSAVIHLHSLGLAHNDINPENVLVNKDGLPVLIDFGSCQPPKKRLLTSGTPGWAYDTFTHSDERNDLFALGKMLLWLEDPTFE